MVPVLSIIFMIISCLGVFGLTIGMPIFLKKKYNADIMPFFTGAAVMFVFAFVLEALVHRFVLANTSLGATFFPFAIYGGLMAGVFEETGRLVAFKSVLKNKMDKDANALMYGAGHGCLEAVWLLGFAMINNLTWALMINNGSAAQLLASAPAGMEVQVEQTIAALTGSAPILFIAGLIERLFAITIQVSLSVIVWFAVKEKKIELYFFAIILHAFVDFMSAIASGAGVSVFLIELMVGIFAVFCAVVARRIWRRFHA